MSSHFAPKYHGSLEEAQVLSVPAGAQTEGATAGADRQQAVPPARRHSQPRELKNHPSRATRIPVQWGSRVAP